MNTRPLLARRKGSKIENYILYLYIFFRPLIDDDESEEFQAFLDGLDEEEEEGDEDLDIEQFIRNDKFIQDYEIKDTDTISSFCRDKSKSSKPS